jgi:hypothetical protein
MRNDKLIAYQKAQDSAEHYNNMSWTLITVGLGFSLTILYKSLTMEGAHLKLGMLIVGLLVVRYFSYLIEGAQEKKEWKYFYCQKIEEESLKRNGDDKFFPHLGLHLFGESDESISKHQRGLWWFMGAKIVLYIFYSYLIIKTLHVLSPDIICFWLLVILFLFFVLWNITLFEWKNLRKSKSRQERFKDIYKLLLKRKRIIRAKKNYYKFPVYLFVITLICVIAVIYTFVFFAKVEVIPALIINCSIPFFQVS